MAEPIRLSPEWMQSVDDRILEFLDNEGASSPKYIANDGRVVYGREYIGRRLRQLLEVELVERRGRGVYRITEKGRGYLEGQEDLRDEAEPD